MVKWDEDKERLLLELVQQQLQSEKAPDNGLKSVQWEIIIEAFNKSATEKFTKQQCENKLSELKGKYSVFKLLKDSSGFGWDDVRKLPTAPEATWNDFCSVSER